MIDPIYNTRASKHRTQWPAPDYEEGSDSDEPIYNTHSFGEPFIVKQKLRYSVVVGVLTLAVMVATMTIVGYLWH